MHKCREAQGCARAAPTGLIQIALGRSSPVDSVHPAPRPAGGSAVQIVLVTICRGALRAPVGRLRRPRIEPHSRCVDVTGLHGISIATTPAVGGLGSFNAGLTAQYLFKQCQDSSVLWPIRCLLLANQLLEVKHAKVARRHWHIGRGINQIFVSFIVADEPQDIQRSGTRHEQQVPACHDVVSCRSYCGLVLAKVGFEFIQGTHEPTCVFFANSNQGIDVKRCDRRTLNYSRDTTNNDVLNLVFVEEF